MTIIRKLLFILLFGMFCRPSMAEEVDSFLSRQVFDPHAALLDVDILEKRLLSYRVFDHTSSHPWVTKGKLYRITIQTDSATTLHHYIDENGCSYTLTGSFFALSEVFRKEGLFLLDEDAISQQLIRFMYETTLNQGSSIFLCDVVYSIYKKGLNDKEFSPLQELINQNGGGSCKR